MLVGEKFVQSLVAFLTFLVTVVSRQMSSGTSLTAMFFCTCMC